MKIAVTGGTGFLGSAVVKEAQARGHEIVLLSRRTGGRAPSPGVEILEWRREGDAKLPPVDAIINLAGENIGQRWNPTVKDEILSSRRDGTRRLVDAIRAIDNAGEQRPKFLVSASAVGYYGERGEEILTEESPPAADGFLAGVCKSWEAEAEKAEELGVRVVVIRIGVVLGKGGGALEKLLPPFKMGVGGPLGNGTQWFPWVHQSDVAGLLLWALENEQVSGPVNGVAPGIVRGKEFAQELGKALHRPAILPTPVFGLRIIVGEFAKHLVESQHVEPKAALAAGYSFRFPNLPEALADATA